MPKSKDELRQEIKDERTEKRQEQRFLRKLSEAQAPRGLKKVYLRLKDATERAIRESEKRIKRLRERRQRKDNDVRKKILEYAQWGYANEPSIHYQQSRPIDGLTSKDYKRLPKYTDCSGFATLAYAYAGAPDPNGFGYNGYGYTGTILTACEHISQSQMKAGDLIVFGSSPGTHVVIAMEDGAKSDPMCMSHGQESGPRPYPLSVQKSAHPGQTVTFCRSIKES